LQQINCRWPWNFDAHLTPKNAEAGDTTAAARRAGKEAFKELLNKLFG
jgi:hypothetical protein